MASMVGINLLMGLLTIDVIFMAFNLQQSQTELSMVMIDAY